MHDEPDEPLSARNGDLARGLAWCLAGEGGEREVRIVGELALSCAARIPEVGQRSAKTANACIAALGETMSEGATAQLTRLLAAIEYPQARALIEKALQSAAARRGGAVPDAAATRGPGA
ncbi:MAG TPA: hypothetical protein VFQ45_00885, partial [Longimicrobium sp.]|nr:hypothetical protein [Longimicrobium sp.]